MIKINLFPEEYIKKYTLEIKERIGIYICIIEIFFIVILVIFQIFQNIQLEIKKRRIRQIENELKTFFPTYSQVKTIKEYLKKIDPKIKELDQLLKSRILWHKKLYKIYFHLPENIWLTELGFEEKKEEIKSPEKSTTEGKKSTTEEGKKKTMTKILHFLIIKGTCVTKNQSQLESIIHYIKRLKNDSEFFNDFDNINIVSINGEKKEKFNLYLIDFSLQLQLKEQTKTETQSIKNEKK
ncbi:MAG: hypothetical protein NC816_01385 [Candidatus Omnitrophica bacterium]|nr:hypothetical protein [Candidatus Omnitrophota bacterium]